MKKILKTKIFGAKSKGFSLVEVLCAVVLLALVATPILQALYSGMVVNNKSRKMLAAADLASDTTEFISSLAFNDFKYNNSVGTEITVPGLKSYYWGNDIELPAHPTMEFNSLKLFSSQILYPNGPHAIVDSLGYTNESGWDSGTYKRWVKFKEVSMDGYEFYVKITTKVPEKKVGVNLSGNPVYENFTSSDLTGQKYFCYDVTVEVIEPGTNKVMATTSTTVPNRF